MSDKFGAWPSREAAELFLRGLVEDGVVFDKSFGTDPSLAHFLIQQGIAPPAYARYKTQQPQFAATLQMDAISASAETHAYLDVLQKMVTGLNEIDIPVVVLKGAALALCAYPSPGWRTMSDVDVWIHKDDMPRAIAAMAGLGFEQIGSKAGEEGQLSHSGKIKFNLPGWSMGGLELHTNPFAGLFLEASAAIDLDAIWSRKVSLESMEGAYRLSAEDFFLQVALHLTASNQFSLAALRGLLDMMMIAKSLSASWLLIAARAQLWQAKTAIWLVLSIIDDIFQPDGLREVVASLAPSKLRQRTLAQFVTTDGVLLGRDFRHSKKRYLYLAALVDKPSRLPHVFQKLRSR